MYRNNDYDCHTDSEVDLYINSKYTPINTTTDSCVQKYLTSPNIQPFTTFSFCTSFTTPFSNSSIFRFGYI